MQVLPRNINILNWYFCLKFVVQRPISCVYCMVAGWYKSRYELWNIPLTFLRIFWWQKQHVAWALPCLSFPIVWALPQSSICISYCRNWQLWKCAGEPVLIIVCEHYLEVLNTVEPVSIVTICIVSHSYCSFLLVPKNIQHKQCIRIVVASFLTLFAWVSHS